MKILVDTKEIISFEDFRLAWRWDEIHNPDISLEDIRQIKPLSILESKRINLIIDKYNEEKKIVGRFEPTDLFIASSDTNKSVEKFSNDFNNLTKDFCENLIISWDQSTCIYTTKEIFVKYWDDFCYPSSDDIMIISELTNWVLFYYHYEECRFWKKINKNDR